MLSRQDRSGQYLINHPSHSELLKPISRDLKNKFTRTPSDIFPAGVCELIVTYRRATTKRVKVTSAEEAVTFARDNFYFPEVISYCEKFYTLFLDRAGNAFAWKQMSSGGLSGTVADPRLIFQTALLTHSTSIILFHNHPSGNTNPSATDIQLTKSLCEAGRFLEIHVLDHIIVTVDGFYSFANEGLIL